MDSPHNPPSDFHQTYSNTQKVQLPPQNTHFAYANTLAQTLPHSSNLQAFLSHDDDSAPIADADELNREEQLMSLQKKWGQKFNENSFSVSQKSSTASRASSQNSPDATLRDSLHKFTVTANRTFRSSQGFHDNTINSIELSFLGAKWLPLFLEKWSSEHIRIHFCFFTDQNILSPCLQYSKEPTPGATLAFRRAFTYYFNNHQNDLRFNDHLNKPLHISITDASGHIILAYGIINLNNIAYGSISDKRFYEVDLFSPHDNSFLCGSIQISCLTTNQSSHTDSFKPSFQVIDSQEPSILWDIEPGFANVLPLEVLNPFSKIQKVYVAVESCNPHEYRDCKFELVTNEEEILFWERKKSPESEKPMITRLNEDVNIKGKFSINIGPNDRITVLVKLVYLNAQPVVNPHHNLKYKLVVHFHEEKTTMTTLVIPQLLSPVISKSIQVYQSTTNSSGFRLKVATPKSFAVSLNKTSSPLQLIVLDNPCCSWRWKNYLDSIEVFWTPIKGMQEATCNILVFADRYFSEIAEIIQLNFKTSEVIEFTGKVGQINHLTLPIRLRKGGVSKAQLVSESSLISSLHGLHKIHDPFSLQNISVSLFTVNETKQTFPLIYYDSISEEILQSWVITAKFELPQLPEDEASQAPLEICRECSKFINATDHLLNELIVQVYRGWNPRLTQIQEFSEKAFELILGLNNCLENEGLNEDLKAVITSLTRSLVNHHCTLNALGTVHNIRDIIEDGILSSLFIDILKVSTASFSEQLSNISLKYILECTPKAFGSAKAISRDYRKSPFINAIEAIFGILEGIEKLALSYPMTKDIGMTDHVDKLIIQIAAQTPSNTPKNSSKLQNIASDIQVLGRQAITATKELLKDQNNLSSHAAAFFELVIAALAKVYIQSDSDHSLHPLVTLSIKVSGENSQTNGGVLERVKDFIEKAEDTLKSWKQESIQKDELGLSTFVLEAFTKSIEDKLVDQAENLQNRWSLITLGQYKVLERLLVQAQHITLLTKFEDLFTESAHQKIVSLLDSTITGHGDMYERLSNLKYTMIVLAFDQGLYGRLAQQKAQHHLDLCAYEKMLKVLRGVINFGKMLVTIVERYQRQIKADDEFLALIHELETFIKTDEEIYRNLDGAFEGYGENYKEIFIFLAAYIKDIKEGLGLEEEKIIIIRRTVEVIIGMDKSEEEIDNVMKKTQIYKGNDNWSDLIALKPRIEGVVNRIDEANQVLDKYRAFGSNSVKILYGLEEEERIMKKIRSEETRNAQAYLGHILKEIEKYQTKPKQRGVDLK